MNKIDKMSLKNCVFVFETSEDLKDFWNTVFGNTENSEVIGNKFIVMKKRWFHKVLEMILGV